MADTVEYARLMEAVCVAEQAHTDAQVVEREARHAATACENVLIQARKAFADYLVTNHPQMVDEISKRRGRP